MRWIKYILLTLGGLVGLFLVLILIAFFSFHNEDYRRLVTGSIKFFTGYQMSINGSFALKWSREPSLSATDIRFATTKDGAQSPVRSIGRLKVKVALSPLLTGTIVVKQLIVDDVVMSIPTAETIKPEDSTESIKKAPPDFFIPILEHVQLQNIQFNLVNKATHRTLRIRLQQFRIDEVQKAASLVVKGEGTLSDHDFRIEGELGALADIMKREKPYPVELSLNLVDLKVLVSGSVEDPMQGKGLNLRLSGEAGELSKTLNLFQLKVPLLGRLKFEAAVSGDVFAPKVPELNMTLSDGTQLEFSVNGSIANIISGEGADLLFSGLCTNQNIIRMLLPEKMPVFKAIKITGNLRRTRKKFALEDIKASAAASEGLTLAAGGRIDLGPIIRKPAIKTLDLTLQLTSPTSAPFKPYLTGSLPDLGAVTAKTRILGALNRFQLTGIDLRTTNSEGLKASFSGNINFSKKRESGLIGNLDIQVKIASPSMAAATKPFDLTFLPSLEPVRATARITGTTEVLSIKNIVTSVGHSDSIFTEWKGHIGSVPLSGDQPLSDVNLSVSVSARKTSILFSQLGISAPDIGPLTGMWRIQDNKEAIGVQDVEILIGDPKKCHLKAVGNVDSILRGWGLSINGVNLQVSAQDLAIDTVSKLIGQTLPELGIVNGSFVLSGSPAALAVKQVKMSTSSPRGLIISATGGVGRIDMADKKPFEGVDIVLTASAPGADAIPGLVDFDFPDLGQLKMSAELNDRNGALGIEMFDISTGSKEKHVLQIQGEIRHILDFKQAVMQANFETASKPWVEKFRLQSSPQNYHLNGVVRVSGRREGLHIDEFQISTMDQTQMFIRTQGNIQNISGLPGVDLDITIEAGDLALIGSILGKPLPPLGPLAINGGIKGNAQKAVFEGQTRINETVLSSTIKGEFSTRRLRIDADIAAPVINLLQLGLFSELTKKDPASTSESKSKKGDQMFDDTPLSFDVLNAVDLSLNLDVEKLIGRDFVFGKVNLGILLENGRLRIKPANLIYSNGFVSMDISFDDSKPIPQAHVQITAKDIDIKHMFVLAPAFPAPQGELNLVVDLQSAGISAREIVSHLNGEFSAAIENGRIRRVIDFLSADAFDMVFATLKGEKYTALQCLAFRLKFQEGIGRVQLFFMETPEVRAKGAGLVNLATETIDLVFQPTAKKKLFGKRSSLRINGPLANPSIRKLPFEAAAHLYADIMAPTVMIPANALGYLWSLMKNDKNAMPCVLETR